MTPADEVERPPKVMELVVLMSGKVKVRAFSYEVVSTERSPAADVLTNPAFERAGMVRFPLVSIERAAVVPVAVPATVVVEKYREPPAFLRVHSDTLAPPESES